MTENGNAIHAKISMDAIIFLRVLTPRNSEVACKSPVNKVLLLAIIFLIYLPVLKVYLNFVTFLNVDFKLLFTFSSN